MMPEVADDARYNKQRSLRLLNDVHKQHQEVQYLTMLCVSILGSNCDYISFGR